MKLFTSIFVLVMVVSLIGCAPTPPPIQEEPWPPDWFASTPSSLDFIVVTAMATSRRVDVAIDKAEDACALKMSEALEQKVMGLTKRFMEEVETEEASLYTGVFSRTSKRITSAILNGAFIEKKAFQDRPRGSGNFQAVALMTMPIGAAKQQLLSQINQKADLARFRAGQAHDELEDEVERFESWKSEQNGNLRMFTGNE
ncbi:MAG: hypothetical protein P9M15_06905 [Candidatus Electryoneaceae bacterium]|nr:hypothetical protein [Candidatus Electryoneaceae bacterium]